MGMTAGLSIAPVNKQSIIYCLAISHMLLDGFSVLLLSGYFRQKKTLKLWLSQGPEVLIGFVPESRFETS